ncbi:hypothetical protein BC749_101158 [Flavobacterium araucananum]|uniref:Uncharacterized protein n=1 Tax=Flavobacterium araucananum TaxID=946678 RepID=A0A227PDY5_9FLAO|nr:hypothetical protein [Flavobacterium araucananum]OXG07723.1 hypothetical protein B0A64_07685 [Flavobacterium araucananum]PWK02098.1 hypothetical protein BC749_101158 [Flavobacterium araucananum]
MNKYIIKTMAVATILITLNGCAQNTKKQESMSTQFQDKIKNNYKNIKIYDYNPVYQIRFDKYNCPIEIYINEILVVSLLDNDRSAGEQIIQIPEYILKSGLQTIRVKIYPLLDKNKNFEKFVSRDLWLKLRVTYQDYEKDKTAEAKEVFKAELPKIEEDSPYLEFKREFKATVPYTLEGWSKGVDLSKEDPEKLEAEVKGRMKEIADLYQNKDIEGLIREQYKRMQEVDQSYYFHTKKNSEDLLVELQESLNESKKTELLEGKMKLMANGKLVTILVDKGVFFNEGIIRTDIGDSYAFYPQFFYRPSPGAKLEIIR